MPSLTQDNLPSFKSKYEKALAKNTPVFLFEGVEVLTSYAKYAIEYMEMEPVEKEVNLHAIQYEEDNP